MAEEIIDEAVFKDEDKMNSLYSPIRSEAVNPTDRISKFSFWKKTIATYCKKHSQFMITSSALKVNFYVGGRSPQCLDDVLLDMLQNRETTELSKYLEKSPASWRNWFMHVLITKPISWSFKKLKDSVYGINLNDTFIHLDMLKQESIRLLSVIPDGKKDEILSLDDLIVLVKCDFPELNAENAELLVHELANNSKADMLIDQSGSHNICLLKIYSKGVVPIVELDISIYKLKHKEIFLINEIQCLEDKMKTLLDNTKSSLKNGNKHLAKTYLRNKKEVEKRLTKNANALYNIQILLEQLHDSKTNQSVIDAYKQAAVAFKTTANTVNEDEISDVMDDVREMLQISEDTQSELSKSLKEDDLSLEEELQQLMEETKNVEDDKDSQIITAMENLKVSSVDPAKKATQQTV